MVKVRPALLGALALLTLGGILTPVALASGPFWHVNGSKFESGARQIKLQVKGAVILKSASLKLEIECKNSITEGATIGGSKETQGQMKGRLTLTQCAVLQPSGCGIVQPILSKGLTWGISHLLGTKRGAKVQAAVGRLIWPLHLTTCGALIELEVDGSVAAEILPVGAETQEDLFSFPVTPITKVEQEGVEQGVQLEIAGVPATFSGAYGARLATFPEKFGIFDS